MSTTYIHPTAQVVEDATIGEGTKIWNYVNIRSGVIIGKNCIIGQNVYIDTNVKIGDNCKIQNGAQLFQGVTLQDGVFIGPGVVFTNDLHPRAVNVDGTLKSVSDWHVSLTLVKTGASIGANSTIVCDRIIGSWVLIGAGSVVTKDVPDQECWVGTPAHFHRYVCKCGKTLPYCMKHLPPGGGKWKNANNCPDNCIKARICAECAYKTTNNTNITVTDTT